MILTKKDTLKVFGKAIVRSTSSGIIRHKDDYIHFRENDFKAYFKQLAKENGVRYISSMKDATIVKSLMKNYSNKEIKTCIDYLWSGKHTFFCRGRELTKMEYGWFLLSSVWLQSWFNLAMEDISDDDLKASNRGWKSSSEGGVSIGW